MLRWGKVECMFARVGKDLLSQPLSENIGIKMKIDMKSCCEEL